MPAPRSENREAQPAQIRFASSSGGSGGKLQLKDCCAGNTAVREPRTLSHTQLEPPGDRAGRAIGFTLVELLVVIGIISLLISILLPSLARARDAAVTVQCMSRMRQLGVYLAMYANDNNGAFPMEYQVWGPTMKWVTWQDRLSQYDGRNLTDAEMDSWQIISATGKDAKGLCEWSMA